MKDKVLAILLIGAILLSCSKSEKKQSVSECVNVSENKNLNNATRNSDSLTTSKLKDKVEQKVNETESKISHAANKAKENIDGAEEKIKNNTSDIKKDVKEFTKNSTEKVKEEAHNIKEKL